MKRTLSRWLPAATMALVLAVTACSSATRAKSSSTTRPPVRIASTSTVAESTTSSSSTTVPPPSTVVPPTTVTVPVVRAVPAPSSIMIIGDSGMFDASPAIEALYRALGTTTVVNVAFPGVGFTNFSGWRTAWPGLVATSRPQLIVAMIGGWDFGYVQAHGGAAYEAVLNSATAILTAAGGRILWLGMPPPTKPANLASTLDPLLQLSAARHPGIAAYADPATVLTALNGTTPRWLPDATGHLVLVRKPDDWHFCPDGAVRVADFIGAVVAQLGWGPAPRPGWENGSWWADHRYNDPPGSCDTTLPQNAPAP